MSLLEFKTLCCTKVPLHVVAPVGVAGLQTGGEEERTRVKIPGHLFSGDPLPVRPEIAAHRLVKIQFSQLAFPPDPTYVSGW
jgi:hypothetical protein